MYCKKIKYTNFNGETIEDEEYFHMSKTDLSKLQIKGFENMPYKDALQKVIKEKDMFRVLVMYADLILSAYGKKSEDGSTFVKNDEIRTKFEQSAAFEALLDEITQNEDAAKEFINNILPKDIVEEVNKQNLSVVK